VKVRIRGKDNLVGCNVKGVRRTVSSMALMPGLRPWRDSSEVGMELTIHQPSPTNLLHSPAPPPLISSCSSVNNKSMRAQSLPLPSLSDDLLAKRCARSHRLEMRTGATAQCCRMVIADCRLHARVLRTLRVMGLALHI
jgi:hypothetical protein